MPFHAYQVVIATQRIRAVHVIGLVSVLASPTLSPILNPKILLSWNGFSQQNKLYSQGFFYSFPKYQMYSWRCRKRLFYTVRRINRDLKQITTATPTTVAKSNLKMTHCACLEMTFRRSAKSYKVKTCLVAQSLLGVFLLFFLTTTGFNTYHRFFTLYQESIGSFRFSSNYVFIACSQLRAIIGQVLHRSYYDLLSQVKILSSTKV